MTYDIYRNMETGEIDNQDGWKARNESLNKLHYMGSTNEEPDFYTAFLGSYITVNDAIRFSNFCDKNGIVLYHDGKNAQIVLPDGKYADENDWRKTVEACFGKKQ